MKSGTYNYFLNGEPTGITETFETSILPDGMEFTSSIRDATPFSTKIAVETIRKGDKFQNCKILFCKDALRIEALYEFSGKALNFLRKIDGNTTDDKVIELPPNCVFFPLMRYFQGNTILQVATNSYPTSVLVPDINDPGNTQSLLQPIFDERTAEPISKAAINLNGFNSEATIYKYLSKNYDENSEFWIAPDGLLLDYKFCQSADKTWSVSLEPGVRHSI